MNILYTLNKKNEHHFQFLYVSLKSLFKNHLNQTLNVFLVHSNFEEKDINLLKELAEKDNQKITFIKFPEEKFKEELELMDKAQNINFDKGAFYRLFLSELLPNDLDRVLYLDCDTIIIKNLKNFFNIDFEGNSIIGVKSHHISEKRKRRYEKWGGFKNYINSGVVMFNFQKVRKTLLKNSLNVCKKYNNLFADQDILNIIFKSKIKKCDEGFNYIVSWDRKKSLSDIYIYITLWEFN